MEMSPGSANSGRVVTVTGPVAPDTIGTALLHEHVICDMRTLMSDPDARDDRPVTPADAAGLRWNPYSLPDNYRLEDVGLAVEELGSFERAGGRTIVDCTPSRYRDPLKLREVAERSGLDIVMGGGHYLEKSHPPELGEQPLESIAAEIVDEARDGVGDTGIRPGIIGEIGTGAPMTSAEERILRAMAWAQVETGLALTVHVHPWGRGGHRVLDVLSAEGVAPERVILNHSFVDIDRPEYEEALLARGATLGYDMFGFDHALFRVGRYPPTDFDVAAELARLVAAGHASQLILSQDVCVKTRLRAFGGWGYAHVLEHVVPLLGELGVGEVDIEQMLVANPRRLLTVR
jgi:phosphotriesterase-related protein